MRYLNAFSGSLAVAVVGALLSFWWGGVTALSLILMLSALEISISFDNAMLNAKVLHQMSPVWQKRFLTWGILIAVFGVRLILPIFLVSLITGLGFTTVLKLAIYEPNHYSAHLIEAHASLSSFGGMFLFMVFLSFLFNTKRSIYWIRSFEKKMSDWGQLKSIEIVVALLVLLIAQHFAKEAVPVQVLVPGIIGIILFVVITTLTEFLEKNQETVHKGFMGFLYLEILDASFSLDGIMGAFAISKDIVLIVIGLTIGAIFVRSLTLFLVKHGTLQKYQYLEHGAHYAIGALAILMLLSLSMPVPEIITGFIGTSFIVISLASSIVYNRKMKR